MVSLILFIFELWNKKKINKIKKNKKNSFADCKWAASDYRFSLKKYLLLFFSLFFIINSYSLSSLITNIRFLGLDFFFSVQRHLIVPKAHSLILPLEFIRSLNSLVLFIFSFYFLAYSFLKLSSDHSTLHWYHNNILAQIM